MELNNWIRSIAERRWPILPNTLKALRSSCAQHSDLLNFTDLANVVLSDPLLLFDLLRVIGSSAALQRAESMPSIEQSMILIGLEGVLNRVAKLSALDESNGHFSAEVLEAISLWLARSRVAALVVKGWLSIADDPRVEDCFVAALIYNLPACFYLMYRNSVSTRPLLQEVSESFGTDYPKLLEQFVQGIPLPVSLLALLSHGPTSRRKQLLRLAVATANGLEGHWRSPWVTGIDTAAHLIGVSFDEVYQVIPNAVLQVAHHSRAAGYGYPARELLFVADSVASRTIATPEIVADAAPNELLAAVARRLSQDLKFERVLCYDYVVAQNILKLAYQVGLPDEHPLQRLSVGLAPDTFFALLTGKSQSFHAPATVRAKLLSKYKDEFFQYIGDHEFAVMTIFSAQTLTAVFYVDNAATRQPISEEDYHRFKEWVTRMMHRH